MAQARTRYEKPRVERFGTLRELTRIGCTLGGDGIWICSVPNPEIVDNGNGNGHDRS